MTSTKPEKQHYQINGKHPETWCKGCGLIKSLVPSEVDQNQMSKFSRNPKKLWKKSKKKHFQEIQKTLWKKFKKKQEETWCKDCGVVEPLVPSEVETNFQAAVISSPLLLLVAVQSLVVDHVGVVVPVVD